MALDAQERSTRGIERRTERRQRLTWYSFSMIRTSGKLTLAAFTNSRTSPGTGRGSGTSSTTSDSGGPYVLQRTAFIKPILCGSTGDTSDLVAHLMRDLPAREAFTRIGVRTLPPKSLNTGYSTF